MRIGPRAERGPGATVMMNWFQRLLPREDKFFDLFESHARTLVAGADALRKLLDGGEDAARFGKIVIDKESEADRIAQEVMQSVRRTFITPFDRSDIQELIQSMDDAIDQMHQTVKTITLFEMHEFDPLTRDLADLAIEAAGITLHAVPLLREIATHASEINAYAVAMTQLEEQSDQMHDEGIRNLFRRYRSSDPMAFIVGSEVYDHLEKVLDKFERVANQVNAIVIEHL
jgi:predicted phosphate transport protein (TIGR00153 family)